MGFSRRNFQLFTYTFLWCYRVCFGVILFTRSMRFVSNLKKTNQIKPLTTLYWPWESGPNSLLRPLLIQLHWPPGLLCHLSPSLLPVPPAPEVPAPGTPWALPSNLLFFLYVLLFPFSLRGSLALCGWCFLTYSLPCSFGTYPHSFFFDPLASSIFFSLVFRLVVGLLSAWASSSYNK